LEEHVGGLNSAHNKAVGYCEDLMKQEQHVRTFFNKHFDQDQKDYRTRLFASIDVIVVVLRYVDKNRSVIERFIGLKHVTSTTSISLKEAFDQLFSKHGLSISRLCGQGYNEAGNMQGEFNGLRTLIMNENECAYYIHCFAHQLQLAIMAVANKHDQVNYFFNVGANVVNVVGASYILREKQLLSVVEALENDDLPSGQGQNQETTLKCFGDTCWGSHYGTLLCIISLFPHIISVLEIIAKDKSNSSDQRFQANYLVEFMQSFDFVLSLYLMRDMLALSNELSQALCCLVYLLVTLALVLPVSTATIERTFSAMKFMKNELWNQMGDEWMNDSLIVYTEKDVFNSIDNESIAQRFRI
ncbi:hypothetical protein CISIN_1g044298mg, partial [Citrus sinensis]